LRAQAVQKTLVLAAQFHVFQAHAAQENIVGDVQHMIALVIRQMHFEQLKMLVNLLD